MGCSLNVELAALGNLPGPARLLVRQAATELRYAHDGLLALTSGRRRDRLLNGILPATSTAADQGTHFMRI
jgi:hypothetical protein